MNLAYDIVSWLSVILLASLMWVLIGKNRKRTAANVFLAIFFGVNILLIAYFWVLNHSLLVINTYNHYLFWSSFFLLAPLLYLYVAAMCRPNFRWRKPMVLHGIMVPVAFVLGCLAFAMRHHETLGQFFWPQGALALTILLHLWTTAYLIAIFGQLSKYDASIKQHFSNLSHVNLSWLTALIAVFVVHWLFDVAGFALYLVMGQQPQVQLLLATFSIGILGVFCLATVIRGLHWPDSAPKLAESEVEKQGPAEDKHDVLRHLMIQSMQQEKAYLHPELTLDDFAKTLGYPSKTVSRCINASMGKNFFEFVNAYRLEEAKHFLAGPDGKGKTISEILYASGFNSKATFNRIFKKHLGITPTQFRQQARRQNMHAETQALESA